jgi:hypothetical protein
LKILVAGFQEAFADKDYLAAANAKQTLQPMPPAEFHKRRNVQTIQSLESVLKQSKYTKQRAANLGRAFARHPGRLRRLIPAGTKDYGATAALFPRVLATATLGFLAFDLGWQYFLASC